MAKQKKTNQIEIPPVPREAIGAVRGEEDFVELLRRGACVADSHEPMNVGPLRDGAMPPTQV